jgi:hypothetical protein
MPKILRLTLFCTLIFSCRVTKKIDESKCNLNQVGNFVEYSFNNSGMAHWKKISYLISRTELREMIISQVDILSESDTSYYDVKWLTPCSYEMSFIRSTNKYLDSLVKGKAFSVKHKISIVESNSRFYIKQIDKQKRLDTVWVR